MFLYLFYFLLLASLRGARRRPAVAHAAPLMHAGHRLALASATGVLPVPDDRVVGRT